MKLNWLKFSAIFLITLLPQSVFAHEGHNEAPGQEEQAENAGPIVLSVEAIKNLSVAVEEADVRTLQHTIMVIGNIQAVPKGIAAVSSRISGRIIKLNVSEGEKVSEGQVLLEVESRQLGNPPPRVQLKAPQEGIVLDRHVVLGDAVEPDTHLMEVLDLSEVYAEGLIFEGQVASIKLGQKVRVYVESYPKESFNGTVDLISGNLDLETRTLSIKVRIENANLKLRPNMRATLNIVTEEADSVVAVPRSAVLGQAGNLFVFVQSDTNNLEFEKRSVVTGMKDDRYIEIIEGVYPSEKVVTEGNYQLQYVTTRKAPEKIVAEEGQAHEHVDKTSYLRITIIGCLLLIIVVVARKKRNDINLGR